MKQIFVILCSLLILALPVKGNTQETTVKIIHVVVALCDNESQGIVPVPPKIGNGDDPFNNLYWGCAYGVSTYFKKDPDWKLVKTIKDPKPEIYERLVFKSKTTETYLVADAYAGRKIKNATVDFLDFSAGLKKIELKDESFEIIAGGGADLVVYIGHNGLMDFQLESTPANSDGKKRDAAVFACLSKKYFKKPLEKAGARPLLLTTNLMSPEAYSLEALAENWLKNESPTAIHEQVAANYHKYQKCGLKAATRLFVNADQLD